MSDGGYGDGYDAGFFEGGKTWKAKALDLEVKRDIAVSTLEKVKADRSVAQKALAEQCAETKRLRAEIARTKEVSELGHALFAKQLVENDQLRVQINVLREALSKMHDTYFKTDEDEELCERALASAPEQSLAEYRNKVIEELAITIQNDESGRDGNGYFAELIRTRKEQS